MAISEDYIVFSNGRHISVYNITWKSGGLDTKGLATTINNLQFDEKNIAAIFLGNNNCDFSVAFSNRFQSENEGIIIHKKTIITISPVKVTLYTANGSIISHITSGASEGNSLTCNETLGY